MRSGLINVSVSRGVGSLQEDAVRRGGGGASEDDETDDDGDGLRRPVRLKPKPAERSEVNRRAATHAGPADCVWSSEQRVLRRTGEQGTHADLPLRGTTTNGPR